MRAISGQIESQVGQPARHRQVADVDQRTAIDLDKSSSGRESYLRGAQYKHNEMEGIFDDAELCYVVENWGRLSEDLKPAVIAIVKSSE